MSNTKTLKKIPVRIYRCPFCRYDCEWRFLLKNHLVHKHKKGKREALIIATENEYMLQNPRKYVKLEELAEDDEGGDE